jgi:ABC-2 type transport system ATP-binding protein
VLEIRNLTKRFRGAPVVDDVSFAVRPGEITGYLGPNGSGKSTTVKILTGLLHATSGHVLYQGQDIFHDTIAFRQRLGYVPEEPNLYGYLTGLEYLQLAGGLRGLPSNMVTRRANQLLDLLYLHEARWLAIGNYSKGMKQRVLIAAALLHDPDVLIFDEAQSGLDITNSLLFRHLLRELAARGKVVLYIACTGVGRKDLRPHRGHRPRPHRSRRLRGAPADITATAEPGGSLHAACASGRFGVESPGDNFRPHSAMTH